MINMEMKFDTPDIIPRQKAHECRTKGICINPECGSVNLDGGDTSFDLDYAYEAVNCLTCGWSWEETYTFAEIDTISDIDGNEINIIY